MRYRKPTASIVNNVGIWHDIMVGLARIAVITNAFLIAVTSDFIPRLVYTTYHSHTGRPLYQGRIQNAREDRSFSQISLEVPAEPASHCNLNS